MSTNLTEIKKLSYTFPEATMVSGLSRWSLQRAADRGDLKIIKVGGRAIIPADDLASLCGASYALRKDE